MRSPRWKRRPPGSNWGEFGPDDCIGRLNLLSREKILQGIDCVKEGRSFCLSLPLDFPGGNPVTGLRQGFIDRPAHTVNKHAGEGLLGKITGMAQ